MEIKIKIEAVELVEALNKLAEAIAGQSTQVEEVKPKTSRKKKEPAAEKPQPVEQPQPQPEPIPEPIPVEQPEPIQPPTIQTPIQPQPATCGTCETFTSDTALHSVGKCGNPAGQNVNGWTPTDNTSCNAYTPPPVQQTIIPTTPQPPVQETTPQSIIPTKPPAQPQTAPPSPLPTQTPTYKLSDIQLAAQQLMDAGKQQELRNLLTSFGVQALVKLPPEQYANFAAQLRAMGARI